MKLTWKKDNKSKKRPLAAISKYPNLPFDQQQDFEESIKTDNKNEDNGNSKQVVTSNEPSNSDSDSQLAESFQSQGNKLAEDGKYREALGKWEAALNLMPESAVLHEQKAQVLLEIGDAWNALRAATRASELEPSWAEAWVTLGRAQLNFGEPDSAIKSFDRALAIKITW
ncbi:tetratricopeptide repeat protein 33 isoform X3 [Jatropha curcas]|uniref:tetratricopeptide repeat protein 33 isoform X3 n=1 Tax=Jatropha curcas TaxID=180498 RepID=UPI0009D67CB1|nr:tetratricopeptide repeat protein 33 isoform X3 [Jatropha curcas]